jgi:hypothetical protein
MAPHAILVLQIAITAKAHNKPFYVAAESYKFSRLYPLSQKVRTSWLRCSCRWHAWMNRRLFHYFWDELHERALFVCVQCDQTPGTFKGRQGVNDHPGLVSTTYCNLGLRD